MNFFNPIIVWLCVLIFLSVTCVAQNKSSHDLDFTSLPATWDEGIPLGNGMLGALIWQKDSFLRFSLDRADLWDLRPVREFSLSQFSFPWVREQYMKNSYDTVQQLFDLPYDRDPAPTKIPAGALEFPLMDLGKIASVHLFLEHGLCEVKWENGARLLTFVDANRPLGWFFIENIPGNFKIRFVPPSYTKGNADSSGNVVEGGGLQRLGYSKGKTVIRANSIYFQQKGWGDFSYDVSVAWRSEDPSTMEGVWSISSKNTPYSGDRSAWSLTHDAFQSTYKEAFELHSGWWKNYWANSEIHLPDSTLENQWYREIYKFGSASRKGAPPITLQAIWTADNGHLPPWKGDFHNDLNTELSYWPGYSSNHLEESSVFTDWIWKFRDNAEKYTQTYFQKEGINFPGVSTLEGQPMGGWIQYALSPTTSVWLAHHFYLQWKYSMDSVFLKDEAYPFIFKVVTFIDELAVMEGKQKKLPLSSSPEFNDNSIRAWFPRTTNFDLALIRWLYQSAEEMAEVLGKEIEAEYWKNTLSQWPELALSEGSSLLIAPGYPYKESHRHFSHLMAIHPLGIVEWSKGSKDQKIISSSLQDLQTFGTDYWCGYSYAWLGNIKARNRDGDGAAKALKTFATCFCLPNSFHANGDQSGTGKSKFTYRPFTLEGNFAFAAGIQEMLLQSQQGVIRIFPAIPGSWCNVSFRNLRAQGAFLVSASKENGRIIQIRIVAEKGGNLLIENPFGKNRIKVTGTNRVRFKKTGLLEIKTIPEQEIILTGIPGRKNK